MAMTITPKTCSVGLIGHPVGHSLSPVLHNQLYRQLRLDMVYMAHDVVPERVQSAVEGMAAMGYIGFNVTIPHKERVFDMLDDVDPEARFIGAVNTVCIRNGCLTGHNTDGQGFIRALRQKNINAAGKKVLLLGAGGSARAVGIYIAREGAAAILVQNRTLARGQALAELINDYTGKKTAKSLDKIHGDADIIINTTALGMWPHVTGNPLTGIALDPRSIVCDIVYNPEETALLKQAAEQGCTTIGGMGMLIGQALRAVELWTDSQLPDNSWDIMLAASKDAGSE